MRIFLKKTRNYLGLAFGALIVFSSYLAIAAPQQKVLAADGVWISAAQISYNGQFFSGPSTEPNGKIRYTSTNPSVTCNDPDPHSTTYGKAIKQWDYIEFTGNPSQAGVNASTARYTDWIDVNGQGLGTDCQFAAKNISLGNAERAKMTQAQGQCAGRPFDEQAACVQAAAETICKNSGTGFDACVATQKTALPAGGLTPGSTPAPTDVLDNGSDSGGDAAAEDPELDCGTTKTKLDWIICPVVKIVNSAVEGLDNAIISLLEVDKNVVDETQPNSGQRYYTAWQSFRNISLGIVVIAALLMLIGQGLGFEILDAYTIKKVMPRLIVAIIGITLSWQIMKWFVIFTNDLGFGVRALIYEPFKALGSGVIIGGGSSVIITLLTAGGILALKIGGLATLGGTALLALFIAFMVLVVRQMVIVLLIMLAPIAIACYILPNTQSLWKLWHESFSKALLMFPIIMAFLATGRVFAQVATGPGHTPVGDFVGFFAYILPYFLIPVTFRFAGGAVRTIGGFANDRSKGAFDRLKKRRGAILSRNMSDMKHFNYGNERTRFGRGVNTALGAVANPTSMIRGRRGVSARRHSLQGVRGQQNWKENEVVQANQNDDIFLLSVANRELAQSKLDQDTRKRNTAIENLRTARASGNAADIDKYETELNSAQAGVDARQKGMDSANQLPMHMRNSRATQMAAFDALTKTGYQFSQGEEGYQEIESTIQKIAGNDQRARAQMMDSAQYNIRASGQRFDLGGINHGAGFSGKTGTNKGSLYELANGKAESITQLTRNLPAGPPQEDHAIVYQELKAMLPNSKGGNRDEIVKQMNAMEANGIQQFMATRAPAQPEVVQYNAALEAQRAATIPGYVSTWTPPQIAQGWRQENVTRTHGELAERKARTYERPDPNRSP
jgi:hypothetical protein